MKICSIWTPRYPLTAPTVYDLLFSYREWGEFDGDPVGGIVVKSVLQTHSAMLAHRKLPAASLIWVVGLVFCVGCGSKQVLVVPDYDNDYFRSDELQRPDLEVVKTSDARNSNPNQVGTAKTGMFNTKVPYLLDEPVSEFVTKSINTMLDVDPQAERICPVTVRIDTFMVSEHQSLTSEKGVADCLLSFSFPVNADSTSVTSVRAVHEAGSVLDVTSSMEGLLYQCVRDCTKQFLVGSYDQAPSRFLVDHADATAIADMNLRAEAALDDSPSPSVTYNDDLQDPATISWSQWALFYQFFTAQSMKDAYGGGFGFTYMKGQNFNKNLAWGLEIGALAARGTPVERPTSTWTVESSSLFMLYMPINVSLMYPAHGIRDDSFRPYVGIGGGGVFGIESMKADLSRIGSSVEVSNGVFKSAWTGEFVCGAEFGQGAASPFVELRFVYCGRTNVSEGLSAEEEVERAETLYDALVRPDGRVTGGQIYLGIRW